MKKLILLLTFCSLLTCVFTGCNKEESSSEVETTSDVSDVADNSDDSKDDIQIEVETTNVNTIPAFVKGEVDPELVGVWKMDNGLFLRFKDTAVISTIGDLGDSLYIKDEHITIFDEVLDYTFEDEIFSCIIPAEERPTSPGAEKSLEEDQIVLKMEKIDGQSSVTGTYKYIEGTILESFLSMLPEETIMEVTIDEESTQLDLETSGYDAKDGTLTIYNDNSLGFFALDENNNVVATYTIDGENLTIVDANSEEYKLVKVQE